MSDLADIIAGGIQDTQSIKPEFGMGYSEGSIVPFFNVYTSECLSFFMDRIKLNSRTLGSTFILAHPTHGWLGYNATSVTAGSQPFLGDSKGQWTYSYTNVTSGLSFPGRPDGIPEYQGSNICVKMKTVPMSAGNKTFTVETWINPGTANNTRCIFNQGSYTAPYGVGIECAFANARMHVAVSTAGNWAVTYVSPTNTITANEWQHLAWVADGTSIYGYRNGTAVGSGPLNAWSGATIGQIGQRLFDATTNSSFYSGLMDNFRLSNNVRYTSNFTPTTREFSDDANTLVYYKFNSVSGSVTEDFSSNLNHGSLFGGPIAAPTSNPPVLVEGYVTSGLGDDMVVTNDGKRVLVKLLGGDISSYPQYMAMGSSATTPAVTDTTLGSEFTDTRIGLDSFTSGDFFAELEMIVPSMEPNTQPAVFREIGVFTGTPTGSMMMRTVFPDFTKTQDIELQNLVTFKIV